jgi:sortase A
MKHKLSRHIRNARTTPDYYKILTLRTIGNFLILSSLFLIAKTFYQPAKEEISYFIDNQVHKQYVVAKSADEQTTLTKQLQPAEGQKGLLAQALNIKPIEVLVPQDPQFSVVIPKIGANARVVTTNAADENDYLQVLKYAVGHAEGTAFPGEKGHIFLFAHSTDYFWNVGTYNAVFYLLSKLEINDEVDLFYKGERYLYKVSGKEIIDPSQVEYLTRKTNDEFLTLQTCWPPGTTLKRQLIFAKRVAE